MRAVPQSKQIQFRKAPLFGLVAMGSGEAQQGSGSFRMIHSFLRSMHADGKMANYGPALTQRTLRAKVLSA